MTLLRGMTIALGLMFAAMSAATAATTPFSATLGGDQEVPPTTSPASGTLSGTLTGDVGTDNYVFAYKVTYAGLTAPIAPVAGTGGHLHNAPAGSNGPIVHTLDTSPFNYTGTTSGTITGDWRHDDAASPLTEDLAQQLLTGAIYVNLHTTDFPGGEIRGQVKVVPLPAAALLMISALAALGGVGAMGGKATRA